MNHGISCYVEIKCKSFFVSVYLCVWNWLMYWIYAMDGICVEFCRWKKYFKMHKSVCALHLKKYWCILKWIWCVWNYVYSMYLKWKKCCIYHVLDERSWLYDFVYICVKFMFKFGRNDCLCEAACLSLQLSSIFQSSINPQRKGRV